MNIFSAPKMECLEDVREEQGRMRLNWKNKLEIENNGRKLFELTRVKQNGRDNNG